MDLKFRSFKTLYVLQCALATGTVCVVLLLLDAIKNTTIIASLGASAFIAFAMPHTRLSQPRFLIGGYLVGTLVGCLCYYASELPLVDWAFWQANAGAIWGAIAVGLAIFLMVILNVEHPPAAGLALGFVLNEWDIFTVLVVILGIISLAVVKVLLKPVLIDLV